MSTLKMGYIFNKYEIAYISSLMGATFLFNINMNIDDSSETVISKAKESLERKNYVFKDFNDNYILSEEISKYFYPFVSPDQVISGRKKQDGYEQSIVFYLKNRKFTIVEQDLVNRDNFVFTLSEDLDNLYQNIVQFAINEKVENCIDKKSRFIISTSEYKILKDMVAKEDNEGINYFITNLKIDKSHVENIKKLFSEDNEILSLCFFPEYKKKPTNLKYLIYYFINNDCWKLNTDISQGDNITYSSVAEETICNDISAHLYSMTGIRFGKYNNLFK